MDLYGLIGYPLAHSFSKDFFNEKFANEGIDAEYRNFEIKDLSPLREIIDSNPSLKGFNVTSPFKEKIIEYLNEITPEAKAIGAVNVVKVIRNGNDVILEGHNSDIIAFRKTIEPMLDRLHTKAMVLGTGGAAKAVIGALNSMSIQTKIVSRFRRMGCIRYEDLTDEIVKEYNLIINCTSVGMYPETDVCPKIPYESVNTRSILYDLIYNPDETLFLKKGKEKGAVVKNGLEMLLLQAYESWNIWNGISQNNL